MYNIGDKIVYSVHGAGTIVDIQNIEILGDEKKYYILQLPINSIKISIPVDGVEEAVIRPVISKSEGRKVVEILRSEKTEMSENWGQRYRENLETIKTGDIYEIADIVRNLTILDMTKGLSASEKKMLTNSKRIIVSELVIIGALDKDEASQMIDDLITI
ncbi:MAG: CarD family transcriptional regulator [Tissierellia bacterium]|nr:CarD family transcriptional regulator [Tissierellia bacterium]